MTTVTTARPPKTRMALPRAVRLVLPFVVIAGVWSLITATGLVPPRVLTPPTEVVTTAKEMFLNGSLIGYARQSLGRLLAGSLLAIVVGVPVGLALGGNRHLGLASDRFIQFLFGISGIAWLPLAIIWTGFSDRTVILVVAYTAFLPIAANTVQGMRAVPRALDEAVICMGGRAFRLARDVRLYGALPSIIAGIQTGVGYGWRAVIGSEMVVGLGGLGSLIFTARQFGAIDRIIVGMTAIGVIYLVIDRLILRSFRDLTVGRWVAAK